MIDHVQVENAPGQRPPEPGRYRHFKGSEYDLLMVARHSETEELLAVYCAVEEPDRIWVRPVEMFAERVDDGGRVRLRFEPAQEQSRQHRRSATTLQRLRGLGFWFRRSGGRSDPERRGRHPQPSP